MKDKDYRQRIAQSPDVNDKVFRLVQIFRAQRVVLDELDVVVLRDVSLPIVSAKHLVIELLCRKIPDSINNCNAKVLYSS